MNLHPLSILDDYNLDSEIKSLKISGKLDKKYNTDYFSHHRHKLMTVMQYGELKNKVILDLGCGSINCTDKMFEPWFARAASEIGAKVIGIDNYATGNEKLFTEYKIDLTKEDSLDFLKDNSVDVAFMNALMDSPYFYLKPKKFMKIILPQLERIVKDDGVFIYENFML